MESPIVGGSGGWEVRECLFELQRYFSDQIAPLMVHDSVDVLLRHPPELVVNEIQAWAAEQYSIGGAQAPLSDYYFHALKKIHLLAEYKLIPAGVLGPYLENVSAFLLLACPEEDRTLLASNLARLGKTETISSGPVHVLHRQAGSEAPLASAKRPTTGISAAAPAAVPAEVSKAVAEGLRRFTLLFDRLEPSSKDPRATLKTASPEKRRELLSQMLTIAARDSKNGAELDHYLARLRGLGMESRMDQVFRSLSATLPGWAIPVPAEKGSGPQESVGTLEAMHRFITLADDSAEGGRRFHEMVRAAVEQFNEGSLGRAVTMFELAERIIAEKKVDPTRVDLTRRSMHESLDPDKLRAFAEDASRQALLRKVLVFFPALSPEGLLSELEIENRRERRRVLVTLLQVHGTAARRSAFEKLQQPVNPAAGAAGWYFQRNLLNVLRRIPRPEDSPVESEVELLRELLRPGQHILLIKDAIANLAQIRHESGAAALVAAAKEFEALLQKPAGGAYSAEELQTLLDRTYSALARIGTRTAIAAVAEHGLSSTPAFGDARARLAELAAIDLSGEPAIVSRLLAALKKELPRKVFGLVLTRNSAQIERLIESLSGTRSPEVRRAFQEIAQDYSDQPFARAAAGALAAAGGTTSPAAAESAQAPSLSGDLELFGLPSLLQNFAQSEVSGQLTILDRAGSVVASLAFEKGKVASCRAGVLRGKDAVYQLFENPVPGSFSFSARRDGAPGATDGVSMLEVLPLIFEGSRRYDELRQARALVPEGSLLVATGKPPTPLDEEQDTTVFQGVWSRICAGATPAECEADFFVDSFRIYRLLAHWIEDGALEASAAA